MKRTPGLSATFTIIPLLTQAGGHIHRILCYPVNMYSMDNVKASFTQSTGYCACCQESLLYFLVCDFDIGTRVFIGCMHFLACRYILEDVTYRIPRSIGRMFHPCSINCTPFGGLKCIAPFPLSNGVLNSISHRNPIHFTPRLSDKGQNYRIICFAVGETDV